MGKICTSFIKIIRIGDVKLTHCYDPRLFSVFATFASVGKGGATPVRIETKRHTA